MTLQVASIQSKSGLQAVLSTLGFALPPSVVVHVGVGEGTGPASVWMDWAVERAVLVEADKNRLERACDLLIQKGLKADQLHAVAAVVSEGGAEGALDSNTDSVTEKSIGSLTGGVDGSKSGKGKEVTFYRASHPREDGLINPDTLRGYWPGLSLMSTEFVKATTVDEVVLSVAGSASGLATADVAPGNAMSGMACWLVVDCLPAKIVLLGASRLLAQTSVLCVRALRGATQSSPASFAESGLQGLDEFLLDVGFRRVAFVADSHPDVGHAVYSRDSHSILRVMQDPLVAAITERDAKLADLHASLNDANAKFLKLQSAHESQVSIFENDLKEKLQSEAQKQQALHDQLHETTQQLKQASDDAKQKEQALIADCEVLKQKLTESESEINRVLAQLEVQVKAAEKATAQVAAQAVEHAAEHSALIAQIEQATQAEREAEKSREAYQAELAALRAELQSVKQAHADLVDLKTKSDQLLIQRAAEVAELNKAKESLSQTQQQLQVQLEKERLTAQQSVVEIARLSESLLANERQEAELHQQLQVVKEKLSAQVQLVAQEQERLTRLKEELAQAKKTEQSLIQARDQQTQEAEQARAQLKVQAVAQLEAQADAEAKADARIQEIVKERESFAAQRDALVVEKESLLKDKSAVQAQVEEQKKLATERQSKIDELTIALQAEVQKLKGVSVKLDGVTAEKAAVAKQLEAAQKELETSKASLQAAQKAVKDSADAKAKSEQALTDATKELEAVKKSQAELQADLQKQLTDKTQELKSVQSTIEALRAENNELNHRQQLMNEELVKAEGQIELIKDLLLREQGL